MLVLGTGELAELLPAIDPIAAVEEVFRGAIGGGVRMPPEASLYWETEAGETARTLNMPGLLKGERSPVVGTKIINSSLANRWRGLARASGLTLLFDPETARPICIVEAGAISALRTAAVSVLAIELMARRGRDSVAVIGAGRIGACHAELLCGRVTGLRLLRIYDTDPRASAVLAGALNARVAGYKLRIEVAESAEAAITGADVVVSCTTVTEPYIVPEWLCPGALMVNVSLDDLSAEAMIAADRLIVDNWDLIKDDSRRLLGRLYREGRVIGPGEEDRLGARRVNAELKDVVDDVRRGRRGEEEVVVFNPFGMSVLDLSLARAVHRLAVERGVGRTLEL